MRLPEGKRIYASLYDNLFISLPIAFSTICTVYIIFLVRTATQGLCMNIDICVYCMLPDYWYVVKYCYFYSQCIAVNSRQEPSVPSCVCTISPWKPHFLFLVKNFRKWRGFFFVYLGFGLGFFSILHLTSSFCLAENFWKKPTQTHRKTISWSVLFKNNKKLIQPSAPQPQVDVLGLVLIFSVKQLLLNVNPSETLSKHWE